MLMSEPKIHRGKITKITSNWNTRIETGHHEVWLFLLPWNWGHGWWEHYLLNKEKTSCKMRTHFKHCIPWCYADNTNCAWFYFISAEVSAMGVFSLMNPVGRFFWAFHFTATVFCHRNKVVARKDFLTCWLHSSEHIATVRVSQVCKFPQPSSSFHKPGGFAKKSKY